MLKMKSLDGEEDDSLNVIHDNLIKLYNNAGYSEYKHITRDKIEEYFMNYEYELRKGLSHESIVSIYNSCIDELNSFWKNEIKAFINHDDSIDRLIDLINAINNIYNDGYKPFLKFAIDNSSECLDNNIIKLIENPNLCNLDILKSKIVDSKVKEKRNNSSFDELNAYDYAKNKVLSGEYESYAKYLEYLLEEKREYLNGIIGSTEKITKQDKRNIIYTAINDLAGAYKVLLDDYESRGFINKLFDNNTKKLLKEAKKLILESMSLIGYALVTDDTINEFIDYHAKAKTGNDYIVYKTIVKESEDFISKLLERENNKC